MKLISTLNYLRQNKNIFLGAAPEVRNSDKFLIKELQSFFKFLDSLAQISNQDSRDSNSSLLNETNISKISNSDKKLLNLRARSLANALHGLDFNSQNGEIRNQLYSYLDKIIAKTPEIESRHINDLSIYLPTKDITGLAYDSSNFYTVLESDVGAIIKKTENQSNELEVYVNGNIAGHNVSTYDFDTKAFTLRNNREFIPWNLKFKPIVNQLKEIGFKKIDVGVYKLKVNDSKEWLFVMRKPGRAGGGVLLEKSIDLDEKLFQGEKKLISIENPGSADASLQENTFKTPKSTFSLLNTGETVKDSVLTISKEETDKLLDLKPVETVIDPDTGFITGASNSSDLISNLESINNFSITDLENRMRPGVNSPSGFLGANESLNDVLKSDNDYVQGLNLTHQQLAAPLKYSMAVSSKGHGPNFEYNGEKYKIRTFDWSGSILSPFGDQNSASRTVTITRLSDERRMRFSELLPSMIENYGFYQGKETPWRLEPSDVIEMFNLQSN